MILGRGKMMFCIDLFATHMRQELQRNAHKDGWEDNTPEEMSESMLYHAAKLVAAVELGNQQAIREYAADVANEAMMVADCSEVLQLPQAPEPVLIGEVMFDVQDPKSKEKSDGGVAAETLGDAAKMFFERVKSIARMTDEEWVSLTAGKIGPL